MIGFPGLEDFADLLYVYAASISIGPLRFFFVKRMSEGVEKVSSQPIGRCLWWLCKQMKARKSITLGPGGEVWEKLFKGIKGCIQDKNFEWSKEGDMLNLGKAP